MSKFLDISEAIKTRLEEEFGEGEIIVIVERQKEILSEVNKNLGKVKGGVVVVELLGGRSADENAKSPVMSTEYAINLVTSPTLRKGKTPADTLLQKICQAMHRWRLDDDEYYEQTNVGSFNILPHPNFLIYQVKIKKTINL